MIPSGSNPTMSTIRRPISPRSSPNSSVISRSLLVIELLLSLFFINLINYIDFMWSPAHPFISWADIDRYFVTFPYRRLPSILEPRVPAFIKVTILGKMVEGIGRPIEPLRDIVPAVILRQAIRLPGVGLILLRPAGGF